MLFRTLFWFSAGVVLYVYIGYPVLITLLSTLHRTKTGQSHNAGNSLSSFPRVSLVIPARNEEVSIKPRLENILALDYPRDKLEVIVASDGSTDRTNAIVSEYANGIVKLVVLPSHSGKSAAQNTAVSEANGEIMVFSDATGMYNRDSIKRMVCRFADPGVGCVTGRIASLPDDSLVGAGTDVYRSYECFIRAKESILGNLAVATGSIFAIRRDLFAPLPSHLSDDFWLPLRVIKDGYRVVQESAAISFDDENPLDAIFRRRRQVATKDFRTLMSMKELLNPFRFTRVAWGLFSHKLLRWLGAVFLFLIFLSPFFLMDDPLFVSIAAFQMVSYTIVIVGWAFRKTGKVPKLLLGACNFLISNVAVLVGIIYHFAGVETGKWEPNRDKPFEHS